MINARLASHEVPPQLQTSPLNGNILPLGRCFSSLLTQEGPWDEEGVPTHPKQGGQRRVHAAGGFPSPARGHGGTPARRGEHPLTALLGLIRFQELPKIAAARRWNGRREEV